MENQKFLTIPKTSTELANIKTKRKFQPLIRFTTLRCKFQFKKVWIPSVPRFLNSEPSSLTFLVRLWNSSFWLWHILHKYYIVFCTVCCLRYVLKTSRLIHKICWNCFFRTVYFKKEIPLHKKWSFQLRIFSVNVTKSARNCGFGHICWKSS